MDTNDDTNRPIKTSQTVFGIIETINQYGSVTLSELAEVHEKAPSTIHDHLSTLESLEYIVREGNQYRLSLRFLDLGMESRDRINLVKTAQPILRQLADETGEVAWLYMEEYGYAVVLDHARGDRAVRVIGRIGSRKPMHITSSGKAILAYLPEKRVEEIIQARGLSEASDRGISELSKLYSELEAVRDRGYAFNDEEEVRGLRAVGAPIITDGSVQGALSVSGPSNRMRRPRFDETIPELLMAAVNEVELKLTYD